MSLVVTYRIGLSILSQGAPKNTDESTLWKFEIFDTVILHNTASTSNSQRKIWVEEVDKNGKVGNIGDEKLLAKML